MDTILLASIWAKTDKRGDDCILCHPLILHMLDIAACADAILAREPESTRIRMAEILGMEWEEARKWLLLVIACHDLGKACPGFQCKHQLFFSMCSALKLKLPRSPNTRINHAFVSQIALTSLLKEMGWPDEISGLLADAVGCHHGERASPQTISELMGDHNAIGDEEWIQVRRGHMEALLDVFRPSKTPLKETLSGPDFMLLSGLTSFADWIGSNQEWFPFGTPEDCGDLRKWFEIRRRQAESALDSIGWLPRTPLMKEPKRFDQVFRNFSPRPLQLSVAEAVESIRAPSILLVEAPMGEGKTEAALFAHLELQRKFGHRGLYVALPTKATGNAMFKRVLKFLSDQGNDRTLDMQLLHGAALLNDAFQDLRLTGINDMAKGGEVRAGEWFTSKKRALLSEYGVGTVDQALLPVLPVRHNFVRLWGLANRVVVFDEVHAYDTYTGTLLICLIQWLLELGSSIVLLSATLPPSFRRKLAGLVGSVLPEDEKDYPRISVFSKDKAVEQIHFDADPARRITVRLEAIEADLPSMRSALERHLARGGTGLALVNTVQRAQDLYRLFPDGEPVRHDGQRVGKRLQDGTEVYLFHARFPAEGRQRREEFIETTFGNKSEMRHGKKILIATQVAEQSLDLDFDVMATDLAPIDLVLQRAGRLWRHARGRRDVPWPVLIVAGLAGDEPQSFGKPLWWSKVYDEVLLLRTWALLREGGRQNLNLPDEIDRLVKTVYEEQGEVHEFLQERLNKAMEKSDGNACASRGQANQAVIGFPDDASWDQPERFVLFDEDEHFVHRTLMARTRLGDDSVIVIPLFPEDGFDPDFTPDFAGSKHLFMRALSLSRKNVVAKLRSNGISEGWKSSPLLRNCFPLMLNAEGRWILDHTVRLDEELGLVYESKEAE